MEKANLEQEKVEILSNMIPLKKKRNLIPLDKSELIAAKALSTEPSCSFVSISREKRNKILGNRTIVPDVGKYFPKFTAIDPKEKFTRLRNRKYRNILNQHRIRPERTKLESQEFRAHSLFHKKCNKTIFPVPERPSPHQQIIDFSKISGRRNFGPIARSRSPNKSINQSFLDELPSINIKNHVMNLTFDKQVARADHFEPKYDTVQLEYKPKLEIITTRKPIPEFASMMKRNTSKIFFSKECSREYSNCEEIERGRKYIGKTKLKVSSPNLERSLGRDNKMYEAKERDRANAEYTIEARLAILELKNKFQDKFQIQF